MFGPVKVLLGNEVLPMLSREEAATHSFRIAVEGITGDRSDPHITRTAFLHNHHLCCHKHTVYNVPVFESRAPLFQSCKNVVL